MIMNKKKEEQKIDELCEEFNKCLRTLFKPVYEKNEKEINIDIKNDKKKRLLECYYFTLDYFYSYLYKKELKIKITYFYKVGKISVFAKENTLCGNIIFNGEWDCPSFIELKNKADVDYICAYMHDMKPEIREAIEKRKELKLTLPTFLYI